MSQGLGLGSASSSSLLLLLLLRLVFAVVGLPECLQSLSDLCHGGAFAGVFLPTVLVCMYVGV